MFSHEKKKKGITESGEKVFLGQNVARKDPTE